MNTPTPGAAGDSFEKLIAQLRNGDLTPANRADDHDLSDRIERLANATSTPTHVMEGAQREAVAWQCRPRGLVNGHPWHWRECDERDFREKSHCGSVPDEWEFRELFAAPPPPDRVQTRNPESSIAQPERVEAATDRLWKDIWSAGFDVVFQYDFRDNHERIEQAVRKLGLALDKIEDPDYPGSKAPAPPNDASGGVTGADIAFLRDVANWLAKESKGTNPSYELRSGFLDAAANAVSRAADRARKQVDASAQAALAPIGYTLQSTRDGSVLQEFAWCRWSSFNDDMERLREHGWNKSGAAKIVPLYLAAPPPPDQVQTRNPESSIAQPERGEADYKVILGAIEAFVDGNDWSARDMARHVHHALLSAKAAPPTDASSGGVTDDELIEAAARAMVSAWDFQCDGKGRTEDSGDWKMHWELKQGQYRKQARAALEAADRARKPGTWIPVTESTPERLSTAIYWHKSDYGDGFPCIADEWKDEDHLSSATHWLLYRKPHIGAVIRTDGQQAQPE